MALRSASAFSSRSRHFSAFIRNQVAAAPAQFNKVAEFKGGIKEEVVAKASASNISIVASDSSVQSITLAQDVTFTMSGFETGNCVTLILTQDGTGSRTGTFTGVKFAGGAPTLSTAANAIDVVTIFYDGTNYLGNISQEFTD